MRVVLLLLAAVSICRAVTLTGCGQDGLDTQEITQFVDVDSGTDMWADQGDYWEISSDGIVSYADDSMFPGTGNPNAITTQNHVFTIPKVPLYVDEPQCLPGGSIGVATDGIPIYSPWTSSDTDAVENERFDSCQGHPDGSGRYHYHQHPDCVMARDVSSANQLIGVAIDGIPIYGMYDENGAELSSTDLDECHGGPLSSADDRYVYRTTRDFPYIMGCLRGEVPNRQLVEGERLCTMSSATVYDDDQAPDIDECHDDVTTQSTPTTTAESEETTDAEETTPDAEQTTPDAEQTTPESEETTPEPETTTAASRPPRPHRPHRPNRPRPGRRGGKVATYTHVNVDRKSMRNRIMEEAHKKKELVEKKRDSLKRMLKLLLSRANN